MGVNRNASNENENDKLPDEQDEEEERSTDARKEEELLALDSDPGTAFAETPSVRTPTLTNGHTHLAASLESGVVIAQRGERNSERNLLMKTGRASPSLQPRRSVQDDVLVEGIIQYTQRKRSELLEVPSEVASVEEERGVVEITYSSPSDVRISVGTMLLRVFG